MKTMQIIFDLDGTLIDSSDSILAAYRGAFEAIGRVPVCPVTSDIIGPPLKEALALLSGTDDRALLRDLESAFMENYDTKGYRQTMTFPGVTETLQDLASHGICLYIATNKRHKATRLIVDHLNWGCYFSGVFALDSIDPPAPNKAELLKFILCKHGMASASTLYVGDRKEDEFAARVAGTNFVRAAWGYGGESGTVEGRVCRSPVDLGRIWTTGGVNG